MGRPVKQVEELSASDFEKHPVWEYRLDAEEEFGDCALSPVEKLPVKSLGNRLVGTKIRLKNAREYWGFLSCVCLTNAHHNRHFLGLTVFDSNGLRIDLPRYHDVDYREDSPRVFAAALGFKLDEVFPISYDISQVAIGQPQVVKGGIPATPAERLAKDELIRMAVKGE